jgi:hypothetical protein
LPKNSLALHPIQPLSTLVGHADPVFPAELAHHGGDCLADGLRRGGLRGGELEALSDQQAGVQIDDAALDAAAADVDTEPFALRASVGAGIGCRRIRGGHVLTH